MRYFILDIKSIKVGVYLWKEKEVGGSVLSKERPEVSKKRKGKKEEIKRRQS